MKWSLKWDNLEIYFICLKLKLFICSSSSNEANVFLRNIYRVSQKQWITLLTSDRFRISNFDLSQNVRVMNIFRKFAYGCFFYAISINEDMSKCIFSFIS